MLAMPHWMPSLLLMQEGLFAPLECSTTCGFAIPDGNMWVGAVLFTPAFPLAGIIAQLATAQWRECIALRTIAVDHCSFFAHDFMGIGHTSTSFGPSTTTTASFNSWPSGH